MLNSFNKIKKSLKKSDFKIDDGIFCICTTATALLLIVFSTTVSGQQFFGSPITCTLRDVEDEVINSYCWIQTTFTLPASVNGSLGRDFIHPGVSGYVKNENNVQYHSYYQWVCFVLFFQALCFYAPHYLWMIWENKQIETFAALLNTVVKKKDKKKDDKKKKKKDDKDKKKDEEEKKKKEKKKDKKENMKTLVTALVEYFSYHNHYAMKFFFCEILAMFNILGQIFFLDLFLRWKFSSYGWKVMSFMFNEDEKRVDPMSEIFPKITKCNFYTYGVSGTIQNGDALCVLTLNIINEKIFVFLWFWLIFLFICSILKQFFRLLVCISSTFRMELIRLRTTRIDSKLLKIINVKCAIGDWFLLYQLSKNVNRAQFTEIIEKLGEAVKDKEICDESRRKIAVRKNCLSLSWMKFVKMLEYGDFLF